MKSKALFLLILPLSISSGCILSDPVEYGEACPGLDKAGTLSYIENRQTCSAEHAYECTFADQLDEENNRITFDFSTYFNKRYCPPQYPKCKVETVQDLTFYHCEKDTHTEIECARKQLQCKIANAETTDSETGEYECIDPASSNTCGANTCDPNTNYGGVNCFLYSMFSTCKEVGPDKYECQCANGALQCNEKCVDKKSKITCGANDCSKPNYGGEDCTEYDDKRVCEADAEGNYHCVCRKGDILCNGKCITPESSAEYCGAKGLCNDPDRKSENFRGTDCGIGGYCEDGACKCEDGEGILCGDRCVIPESSDTHCGAKGLCNSPNSESDNYQGTNCGIGGYCFEGKCKCYEGIWCVGEDGIGQCMIPPGHETCNAHVIDEAFHCEYTECKVNELCIPESESTYRCDVKSCDETTENLCVVDGHNACVPKFDTNHCGTCDNDCANHNYANIKSYSCAEKDETPTCTYVCTDSAINCGTDIHPVCAVLNTDYNHCGSCNNSCKGNQYCEGGTCHYTDCASNECTIMNGNEKSCINTDAKCGNGCTSCKSLHSNGYCDNGTCYISSCNNGEHPEYSGNKITRCVKNSVTSCGPSTGGSVTNCNSWKPSTASSVDCKSNEGYCYITNCNNGYHLASDQKSCVGNTSSSCAASNSTNAHSCSGPQNKCDNGNCVCPDGKKLNYDGNNCVIPACAGIPGVYDGTLLTSSWYNPGISDWACNPSSCNANYKRVSQGGNGQYWACRPSTSLGCTNYGYRYTTSSDGYCIGGKYVNGQLKNGHSHCADGYRQYITACINQNACCGTRNAAMNNSLDFVCRNCLGQGKTCNTSTGNCQ
ncbi:MAG: hypothetical protein IJU23_02645 [Proteobacteria bacterium]|nr:hypothetical protein [Pseudomonadota bacterium]